MIELGQLRFAGKTARGYIKALFDCVYMMRREIRKPLDTPMHGKQNTRLRFLKKSHECFGDETLENTA